MVVTTNRTRFAPGRDDLDKNLQVIETGENIIPSRSEHQISDGQKRYGTLLGNSSSNYPKPRTMFYVIFNYGDTFNSPIPNSELSKFVISVTKPTITYTTKKMNQYNRIKYVYDNVEYGDLKITFMDVKNSTVEQAFFSYLKNNNNDFNNKHRTLDNDDGAYNTYAPNSSYTYDYSWGLHNRSNERMFKSITIVEMYFDRLIVYTIENPLLKSIDFGENKIGDYSPNNISVTFNVEGITNDLIYDMNKIENDVVGDLFTRFGSEAPNIAHFLGKRWNPGNNIDRTTSPYYVKNNYDYTYNNGNYNNYYSQYMETQNKINYARNINQGVNYRGNNILYSVDSLASSIKGLFDLFRF